MCVLGAVVMMMGIGHTWATKAGTVEACMTEASEEKAMARKLGDAVRIRIENAVKVMHLYGCILVCMESGSVPRYPEDDIFGTYHKFFIKERERSSMKVKAMQLEIVSERGSGEVYVQALASVVYLTNRRNEFLQTFPQIAKRMNRRGCAHLVVSSSSLGARWLTQTVLETFKTKFGDMDVYLEAKRFLMGMKTESGELEPVALRRTISERYSAVVHTQVKLLLHEAQGKWIPGMIKKMQSEFEIVNRNSLGYYFNSELAGVLEYLCVCRSGEMMSLFCGHLWKWEEIKFAAQRYYPQILARIPLGMLVGYLKSALRTEGESAALVPAMHVVEKRTKEMGIERWNVESMATESMLEFMHMFNRGDLRKIREVLEEDGCIEVFRHDSLRRWIVLMKNLEMLKVVLSIAAKRRVLVGVMFDVDESVYIVHSRCHELMRLVWLNGAILRTSKWALGHIDEEFLWEMARTSTLEILGVNYNIETIKKMAYRRQWTLIEGLKGQLPHRSALEIDRCILSMSGYTEKPYEKPYEKYLKEKHILRDSVENGVREGQHVRQLAGMHYVVLVQPEVCLSQE